MNILVQRAQSGDNMAMEQLINENTRIDMEYCKKV